MYTAPCKPSTSLSSCSLLSSVASCSSSHNSTGSSGWGDVLQSPRSLTTIHNWRSTGHDAWGTSWKGMEKGGLPVLSQHVLKPHWQGHGLQPCVLCSVGLGDNGSHVPEGLLKQSKPMKIVELNSTMWNTTINTGNDLGADVVDKFQSKEGRKEQALMSAQSSGSSCGGCLPAEYGRRVRGSSSSSRFASCATVSGRHRHLAVHEKKVIFLRVSGQRDSGKLFAWRTYATLNSISLNSSADEEQIDESLARGASLNQGTVRLTELATSECGLEGNSVSDVAGVRRQGIQESRDSPLFSLHRLENSESVHLVSVPLVVASVTFVEDVDGIRQCEHDGSSHQRQEAIVQEEEDVEGKCCSQCGPVRNRLPTASLSQALTQATGRVLSYTIGAVARPISRGNVFRGPSGIVVAVAFAVVVGLATVVKVREDHQGDLKTCTSCEGKGSEACSVCGGEGHICWEGKCNRDTPCPACLGSGSQKCHICHGIRKRRVPVQSGATKVAEGSFPM